MTDPRVLSKELREIPYTWHRVVSDHPKLNERVLIWDPVEKQSLVAVRESDGFWTESENTTVLILCGGRLFLRLLSARGYKGLGAGVKSSPEAP